MILLRLTSSGMDMQLYCWFLLLCMAIRAYTDNRTNIARGKIVHQSMTHKFHGSLWTADMAIDGQTVFTYNCSCCAGVGYETPGKGPWWEIDLGSSVTVGKVKVVGRTDDLGYGRLHGFKVFISETTRYTHSSSPYVYINDVSDDDYRFKDKGITNILFGETTFRYLAIAKHEPLGFNTQVFMMVCEVEIYKACPDYQFEPDCAVCHCDGSPCNKSTGVCTGRCVPGWKGPRCDQENICDAFTYSTDCVPCGHCRDREACDKLTGLCLRGCDDSYIGDHCTALESPVHGLSVAIGAAAIIACLLAVAGVVAVVMKLRHRSTVQYVNQENGPSQDVTVDGMQNPNSGDSVHEYEVPSRASQTPDEHPYAMLDNPGGDTGELPSQNHETSQL